MSHERIDRSRASRIAMGARAGACVLAVCGMAIAVFGVPGVQTAASAPVPAPDTQVDQPEPATTSQAQAPILDARGIAMRLAAVGNAPKPVAESIVEVPNDGLEPGVEAISPVTDEVGFLGIIREPGRLLALMRVNGRQTIMWIGREVGEVKLTEIGDGYVTIERNGAAQRVDRSARKGEAFTRLEQPQPAAASVPMPTGEQATDAQATGEQEMSREELLRRVREQARGGQRMIRRPQGEDRERFNDPGRPWREER